MLTDLRLIGVILTSLFNIAFYCLGYMSKDALAIILRYSVDIIGLSTDKIQQAKRFDFDDMSHLCISKHLRPQGWWMLTFTIMSISQTPIFRLEIAMNSMGSFSQNRFLKTDRLPIEAQFVNPLCETPRILSGTLNSDSFSHCSHFVQGGCPSSRL